MTNARAGRVLALQPRAAVSRSQRGGLAAAVFAARAWRAGGRGGRGLAPRSRSAAAGRPRVERPVPARPGRRRAPAPSRRRVAARTSGTPAGPWKGRAARSRGPRPNNGRTVLAARAWRRECRRLHRSRRGPRSRGGRADPGGGGAAPLSPSAQMVTPRSRKSSSGRGPNARRLRPRTLTSPPSRDTNTTTRSVRLGNRPSPARSPSPL